MILDEIFGNRTASKILLHLYHYNEIHSAAIAADYGAFKKAPREKKSLKVIAFFD
ncbi:hypothetical protein LEP1GSC016_0274 [Leptospira borgpetersenii serovar Hardjo-bovis str. Sponselee]|uniref:Uncharacterized protein n=2 Tax=Leptospira borgpetersenii TaxID=174 RepID=M6BXB9_LEPBO|nr:hypothetical protein LEP1GSC016_0274 [Leptospira borgpetersenii serovar Hardjo-bovis str. Sponselee]